MMKVELDRLTEHYADFETCCGAKQPQLMTTDKRVVALAVCSPHHPNTAHAAATTKLDRTTRAL